jgi:hypothetical protein
MTTRLDHLVIGAADLPQGVAHVNARFGVAMPYGGEHPQMGTHNHLMQLGGDVFLEVIAINPAAAAPPRPRWFGLDDPFVRQRLATEPTLLTWVVNTDNLEALLERAPFSLGRAAPLRRGDLRWGFGLPADGRLLAGGMLPYAIQWHTEGHPAARMADTGCRLLGLAIHHPNPVWLASALTAIEAADLVTVQALPANAAPYLEASIHTPQGTVRLRGGAFA